MTFPFNKKVYMYDRGIYPASHPFAPVPAITWHRNAQSPAHPGEFNMKFLKCDCHWVSSSNFNQFLYGCIEYNFATKKST